MLFICKADEKLITSLILSHILPLDVKDDDDKGMVELENLVQKLPAANFNTLKFIRYIYAHSI